MICALEAKTWPTGYDTNIVGNSNDVLAADFISYWFPFHEGY